MPTVPGYSRVIDDADGPRATVRLPRLAEPVSVAAREALTEVIDRNQRLTDHLALLEMLLAVGPTVRDAGAMEDALSLLDAIEEGLATSIAALREACGSVGHS
jgi:hypothetical protein